MLTLANDSRFKMGLVLDGWLFPIKDEDLAEQVKQPVLFINTGSTFEVIFLKLRLLKRLSKKFELDTKSSDSFEFSKSSVSPGKKM
jgi:hypothetical protein